MMGGCKQDNEVGYSSLCRSIMIQYNFLTAGCGKLNVSVERIKMVHFNVIVLGCCKQINEIY